ncbi:MAG: SIMPL domain-containing protein, partial [Deltaproteobacteria bacterium]|nr:SIMPL domain-containing protein [Deltaproteobacteria bacterium]
VCDTAVRIRQSGIIEVKGFAQQQVRADMGVWKGYLTVRGQNLAEAYTRLESEMSQVLDHLKRLGFSTDAVAVEPAMTTTLYRMNDSGFQTNQVEGYQLQQFVEVGSGEVEKIATLATEAAGLVKTGMEFISLQPEFYVSFLEEIKLGLIAQATKDALNRAGQFAEGGNVRVGALRSATQGVFQVTPVNSMDVSGYGIYDTRTIEKSVKAVVTAHFAIETGA